MKKNLNVRTKSRVVIIFLGLLLSASTFADPINKEVFSLLNLDYPGLSTVKEACGRCDWEEASQALWEYYRNREGVNQPELDMNHVTYSERDKQKADEALAHILFAHEGYQPSFYYGKNIDWTYWPVKDNELRWQLHRHEWFVPMGKVYYVTRDEKYATEWAFQYMDWIRKNPQVTIAKDEFEMTGDSKLKDYAENARFAWRPLEVVARLENQIPQFLLFRSSKAFTPGFLTEFLVNYHRHADYTLRHYSREGNHLLFEAQRMFYAGSFFPEFKDAGIWRQSGVDVLVREIKKQVFDDGGQYELDPLYHMASIDIFCKALRMAEANGRYDAFPSFYKETIEKMIVFYYNICYPDYTNPCYGDAKRRGKGAKLKSYRQWAKLFPENEQIRYFATEGKEGKKPGNLSKGFPVTGYFTFRNGWEADATVMVFKAGPKGEWHNQPDNGTFELWFNGTNLFPDSGFYVYAGDENIMKLRNWFRQTMVHKTVTLDNKNLETQHSVTRLWSPEGKTPVLVTENQSYKELKHRRTVFFVNQNYFVLVDEATGSARGTVGLHYQVNAGKVKVDEQKMTLTSDYAGDSNFKLQCFAPEGTELHEEEGWQATLYLVREPRKAVSFDVKKQDDRPMRYITIIYPAAKTSEIPTFSARFIDEAYNENGVNVEVIVDGKKEILSCKF